MNMPKPIYESLPILYVIGGVAAISTVDSFMSFISGVLLGSSGIMIMFLRRNHRKSITKRPIIWGVIFCIKFKWFR